MRGHGHAAAPVAPRVAAVPCRIRCGYLQEFQPWSRYHAKPASQPHAQASGDGAFTSSLHSDPDMTFYEGHDFFSTHVTPEQRGAP